MKITSWNINSLKARRAHVETYLKAPAPDVLMVQELKGLDFPHEEFKALGYYTEAVPQKAYNGVAVFSKTPINTILDKLPGDDTDDQARYIEFETNNVRLINIYLPNGNPVFEEASSQRKLGSQSQEEQDPVFQRDDTFGVKYIYKLAWMSRLKNHLAHLRAQNIPFIIGGDFNVIPEDKDCYDPKVWENDALFRLETRKAYRTLLNLGLTEAFRVFDARAEQYTFWDYQAGAWPKNNGIRIDHFLLSPEMADRLEACTIDTAPRALEKPSDHTPITITLSS